MVDGKLPNLQNTPALTTPNRAECDQLSRAGVKKLHIDLPAQKGSSVSVTSLSPETARAILSGYPQTTAVSSPPPRTFDNIETAAGTLVNDLGKRNPDTVQATPSGNGLDFYGSDFVGLVRREAGSTGASIPAITNAQLLCTAPGYIPMRSAQPIDLSAPGATLPSLNPLSTLGTGVNINAH